MIIFFHSLGVSESNKKLGRCSSDGGGGGNSGAYTKGAASLLLNATKHEGQKVVDVAASRCFACSPGLF